MPWRSWEVETSSRNSIGIQQYGATCTVVITGLMRAETLREQKPMTQWRMTFMYLFSFFYWYEVNSNGVCLWGRPAQRQHCLPSWSFMHNVWTTTLYVMLWSILIVYSVVWSDQGIVEANFIIWISCHWVQFTRKLKIGKYTCKIWIMRCC